MEIRQIAKSMRVIESKLEKSTSIDRSINEQSLPQAQEVKKEKVNMEQVKEMIDGANEFFSATRTHLNFQLHEGLDKYYVEIRNSVTDELVKEIPPKKFLDMVAKFQELAGLVVDEKI
jgi:flagellar protein FlaG